MVRLRLTHLPMMAEFVAAPTDEINPVVQPKALPKTPLLCMGQFWDWLKPIVEFAVGTSGLMESHQRQRAVE